MVEVTSETPKVDQRQRLLLIDGHAMVHRAFHALPENLTTPRGEVVNATYGFTTMLLKILNEERPDYVIVTFDRSAPTFRHLQFVDYKAQRPPMPEVMRPQFGRIREIVEAFGIPIYEEDGYEADDLLGTLSLQAKEQGLNTIILTGDMDTLQLVDPYVTVMAAKRGITEVTIYDEEAVKVRYGLGPESIPDFKGLVGDKSDNIPGVPGIGEKTASRLLNDYKDLEGVIAHVNELKPKEQKLISQYQEQARQSKFLATIIRDVPVKLVLPDKEQEHINRERLLELFRELEFRSLINKIPGNGVNRQEEPRREIRSAQPVAGQEEDLLLAPPVGVVPVLPPPLPPETQANFSETPRAQGAIAPTAPAEEPTQMSLFGESAAPNYQETVRRLRMPTDTGTPLILDDNTNKSTETTIIQDEEALQNLVMRLRSAGAFAFDTETSSEDPWQAELVGISLSTSAGKAFYIPVGHQATLTSEDEGEQLPIKTVLSALRPVLADSMIGKYMHNAKYDMLILARYGISIQGLAFDTMLGAYLTNPGRRGLGLKDQAFERLGILMTPITDLIGKGRQALTMAQAPIRQAADYAGADADITLRLVAPITEELQKHQLMDLYTNIENPLLPVLMQMEIHGVALDSEFLHELDERFSEQVAALEKGIYDSVGRPFNVNSTKQLGEILFEELKLPKGKKTKTGYSVNADVIEGLRGQHPVVDNLVEYRQLNKLRSTYVNGLLTLVNPITGRVHTSFNQTVASSGRLSSSNPNLQNIPVRTEVGRQIRRAFIADPSYLFMTADYSQFELRILAHIIHEPRLIEAFTNDEDIHTITAASLFAKEPAEVTKDERRLAKTVVYATLYGQSAFGLSQVTGMSNKDAAAFIQRYHETFPGVKAYVDQTLNQARKQGYVNTLFGRKRFFPDMLALGGNERQALEREAINMPIQGANADLIKIAMIRMQHAIQQNHLKTRMILQVHDELAFEVPVEEIDRVKPLVRSVMEGVAQLDVPIKVEIKVGRNWYEAEPTE